MCTAKGLVFFTMEDEAGLKNVIVRPDVYQRYYKVLRNCFLLIVEGTAQKQGGILDVLAEARRGCSRRPPSLMQRSLTRLVLTARWHSWRAEAG